MTDPQQAPPLVVHVIYALDFGGLETLLVDCINHMPQDRYRHAIVCVTRYSEFAKRISRADVALYALNKPPGLGLSTHWAFWKLMRNLKPSIVHTYNLAAYEYAATAMLAGVPVRIHAEHGRDARDPKGLNRKHNFLRKVLAPCIDAFVPVSLELKQWLHQTIGIPARKLHAINNGVDTLRFRPAQMSDELRQLFHIETDSFVIGSVGRIQDVKDHATLVKAFAILRDLLPHAAARLRLVIIGEGPLLPQLKAQIQNLNLQDVVFTPGARHDIDQVMHCFSLFALSSIAEGTPVTILEAMASGLPIVSTAVGGIPDLVIDGRDGLLVAPSDPNAMASAFARYVQEPALLAAHSAAGRQHIEQSYSTQAMVQAYAALYDGIGQSKHIFLGNKACVES